MNRREAGFTLLEILVALVIFGLVMAGLAQSLRFGLVALQASAVRGAGAEDRAALDRALTRLIEAAEPGSLTGGPGGFAFTTRLPPGAGLGGGLADVAIEMAPGHRLVLLYRAHPPGLPLRPLPPPRRKVLAAGVAAFAMSYYGARGDAPAAWGPRWEDKALPLLLRMHLAAPGAPAWPDLVVAPDPQSG
ncbi:prepilin-type N-terminal cleavage/methylation domain-containing protein [Acidisoma sp. C75]